jgi:hypothetical protein
MAYLDEKGSPGPALASVDASTAYVTARIHPLGTLILFCPTVRPPLT